MHVTVCSAELGTLAATMGASAMELADVGSTLRSCVHCAMPPEIQTKVDQLVAIADKVLDNSASVLSSEAADLSRRALVATNDSLAAASLAAAPETIITLGGTTTSDHWAPILSETIITLGGNTTTDPRASIPSETIITLGGNTTTDHWAPIPPSATVTHAVASGGWFSSSSGVYAVTADGRTLNESDLTVLHEQLRAAANAPPAPAPPQDALGNLLVGQLTGLTSLNSDFFRAAANNRPWPR